MKTIKHTVVPAILTLMMFFNTPVIHAAGSGGGGGSLSVPSTNSRALTPDQLSDKAMRAGIRERDRALKQEARAAKAKTDKKRDKALAKAKKHYDKAANKQREAVQLNPRNYKALNEWGYALRKTGDYRKAIGAYNLALEINPNFHQATEYRGEAFLALGYLNETKQSYMVLFRNDRELAAQLMQTMQDWVNAKSKPESVVTTEEEVEFIAWIEERAKLAKIANDLSANNTRVW
ncbi:MAG: tetratricopeptide repeat protein [Pseudomonadota bacterium]